MTQKIIAAVFSDSIYCTKLKLNHKKYYKALTALENHKVELADPFLDQTKKEKINTGNYITVNKRILHTDKFKDLKNVLNKEIKIAIQEYFKYDIDFTIENSWGTVSEPNAVSEFHTHSNYWFSAVYYPHGIYKDELSIIFDRTLPSLFNVPIKEFIPSNQNQCIIRVTEGDLVVFPASLRHKIGFNFTKQNRYSLALNILPKGNIGHGDGTRKI